LPNGIRLTTKSGEHSASAPSKIGTWRSASATEDPGYVARVNGNELPGRRTDDLESTKRHVEAYILMKLAECQKQMEDANA
jgi:hypothetical protein